MRTAQAQRQQPARKHSSASAGQPTHTACPSLVGRCKSCGPLSRQLPPHWTRPEQAPACTPVASHEVGASVIMTCVMLTSLGLFRTCVMLTSDPVYSMCIMVVRMSYSMHVRMCPRRLLEPTFLRHAAMRRALPCLPGRVYGGSNAISMQSPMTALLTSRLLSSCPNASWTRAIPSSRSGLPG